MKIEIADVAYVADLANLEVPPDQQEAFAVELSRIVEYVEQLNELDTANVEPTPQVVSGATHRGRSDRIESRAGSSEAAEEVGLFKVPRVIGDR
jgi:aspartyl-tRNA(Asn)/glutamyl-tRNA(Gln) amidotransferase subunit C